MMARTSMLALFQTPDAGADAMDGLKAAGLPVGDFDVLTGTPYPEGAFGEHVPQHRLFRFPLFGALVGFALSLFLTAGTQLAYPLVTGGQPIISIFPMLVIMYEMTMLSAVIATVIGIIFESRLPRIGIGLYDSRITEGLIGVVAECDDALANDVAEVLRRAGAMEIKRSDEVIAEPAREREAI